MNKSDLIIKIANLNHSIYQKDANKIVNVFFDTISKALSKNERVEFVVLVYLMLKKEKHELLEIQKMVKQLLFLQKMFPFSEWVKI